MKKSEFPVRLPEGLDKRWRQEILQLSGFTLIQDLEDEMEMVEGISSIHSPLSRFLNGHGTEVELWLRPNKKGEALCEEVLGVSIERLRAIYRGLLPRKGETGLGEEALALLPLRVEWSGISSVPQRFHPWFEENAPSDLQKGSDDKKAIVCWNQFKKDLKVLQQKADQPFAPAAISLRAGSASNRFHHSHAPRTLARQLGDKQLKIIIETSSFFIDEISEEIGEDDILTLNIPFLTIRIEDVRCWLDELKNRSVLSEKEFERIAPKFENISKELFNDFTPAHLINAVEEIRAEDLDALDGIAFHSRRTEWLRRDLRENATHEGWTWLLKTKDFFLRWLKEVGTLEGDCSASQLNDILELQVINPGDVDSDVMVEELVDSHYSGSDEERYESVRRILKGRPNEFKKALIKSQFFLKCDETNRWRLTPELKRLGYSELAQYLKPEHLIKNDFNASYDLIVRRVQLAEPATLEEWCELALARTGVDQPVAILAVLDGLSQRNDHSDSLARDTLRTIWASTIWAGLFGLNWEGSGPTTYPQDILMRVSEVFRDRLPLLVHDEGPIEALRIMVTPTILAAVEQWCAKHVSDEEEIGRVLLSFAPFQMPMESVERFSSERSYILHELLDSGRIVLHLARCGDLVAIRKILCQRLVFGAYEVYQSLDIAEILGFWITLAESKSLPESRSEFFGEDLCRGLQEFSQNPKEDLRRVLRLSILHEELRLNIIDPIAPALIAIDEGPEQAVEWLLRPSGTQHYHRDTLTIADEEVFLTLCQLLKRREILRLLATFDPTQFARRPASLFDASYLHPAEGRPTPEICFRRLETLAKVRHRALILLAEFREPAPLRASLTEGWTIQAPEIARERVRWGALRRATREDSDSQPPKIDDAVWDKLLEKLLWFSADEIFEKLIRSQIYWTNETEDLDKKYKLRAHQLATRFAPPEKRWSILALHLRELWRNCDEAEYQFIWEIIDGTIGEEEGYDIWPEPDELYRERKAWALQNDDQTTREWCAHFPDYNKAISDLDGLGERVWEFLSREQQSEFLRRISKESLPRESASFDIWWSRSANRPLEEHLEFAKVHGTLRQRRQIVDMLLKAKTRTKERLLFWCRQLDKERPNRDVVAGDIEVFLAELPDDVLHGTDYAIAYGLLHRQPSPTQLQQLLPIVIKSRIIEGIKYRESPNSPLIERTYWLTSLFHTVAPTLKSEEMTRRDLDDLHDQLKRISSGVLAIINQNYVEDPEADEATQKAIASEYGQFQESILEMPEELRELQDQIMKLYKKASSPKESYYPQRAAEAREVIAGMSFNADEKGTRLEFLLYELSKEERVQIAKELFINRAIAKDPFALCDLLRLADELPSLAKFAEEHLDELFVAAEGPIKDAPDEETREERRRRTIAVVLSTVFGLRNSVLRKRLRAFAEKIDSLAGIRG